jgi:hypothetical protein
VNVSVNVRPRENEHTLTVIGALDWLGVRTGAGNGRGREGVGADRRSRSLLPTPPFLRSHRPRVSLPSLVQKRQLSSQVTHLPNAQHTQHSTAHSSARAHTPHLAFHAPEGAMAARERGYTGMSPADQAGVITSTSAFAPASSSSHNPNRLAPPAGAGRSGGGTAPAVAAARARIAQSRAAADVPPARAQPLLGAPRASETREQLQEQLQTDGAADDIAVAHHRAPMSAAVAAARAAIVRARTPNEPAPAARPAVLAPSSHGYLLLYRGPPGA